MSALAFATGFDTPKPPPASPRQIYERSIADREERLLRYAETGVEIRHSEDLVPCAVCSGKGYVGSGDSEADWCPAFGCRYGMIWIQDARACPVCQGAHYVMDRSGAKPVLLPCACQGHEGINFDRAMSCGVPAPSASMTPQQWKAKFFKVSPSHIAAYERARDVALGVPRDKQGLFLTGTFGIGKTMLSVCIVVSAFAQGKRPHFIPWPTWGDNLIAGFSRKDDTETSTMIEAAKRTDLLIIDELGGEGSPSDYRKRTLQGILDARYGKPTVVTTNRTEAEISDIYGQNNLGRILDACLVCHLDGEDQRAAGAIRA